MPVPSTPTSFIIAGRGRPWANIPGTGALGNYDSAKLTWTFAGGGERARLQRLKQDSSTEWEDIYVTWGAVSAVVGPILNGTSFRLRAENADGFSAWTADLVFAASTVPVTSEVLTAPTIALAENSTSRVRVTWTDLTQHDSGYELELRNSLTGAAKSYGIPLFAAEFSRVLGTDGVAPETTYTARVRAVSWRGGISPQVNGAWSNELFFTTLPPVIVLVNLPASTDMWRAAPVASSYTVSTNTAPTSLTTGALPAGITLTGAVISGIPTAVVGAYPVTVTATNASGTDVETLTINVREPAIALQFAKPVGTWSDAEGANANGVGNGVLGTPLVMRVRALANGPVSGILTALSLFDAPPWMATVGTSQIGGTPSAPGQWDVLVSGSNGTQSAGAIIRVIVPAVAITSPDSLTVFDQQPISFPVTSSPTADTITADALPSWLTLAGATLTGTAPAPGDTHLTLTATLGTSTASQAFTLHVLPVLTGPPLVDGMAEITGWVGDPLIEAIYYHGTCSIEHWYLSNQPPGVDLGALTCPGPYATNKSVAIVGAPTTYGIFEAVVTAQCCCDGSPKLYRFPVRFNISGGLFLHWFHGDPFRRELQVLLRTGEVHSLYETTSEVLWLKRGDRAKIHILFRDGPFGDSRIARTITTEGFDELRLVIRPLDDFDAEPYFDLGGALVTENVGGKTLAFFEFDVKADAISRAFDETNKARGANPAAAGLQASGELTWKRSGHPDTSKRFAVRISQDIER